MPPNLSVPSLNLAGVLQQFDAGRESARQRRSQNALSEFGAQAFGGDRGALNQLFEDNPQAAISLSQIVQQRENAETAATQRAEDLQFRRERATRADELSERQFEFEQTKFQREFGLQQNQLLFKINQLNQKAQPKLKDINDLRKEFIKNSKTYIEARNAFAKIRSAATSPTPTGTDDIALVFSFMKLLDPGSTVRENEAATVENARDVPASVRNIWNKVFEGTPLTAKQREQILATSERQFAEVDAQQQKVFDFFEDFAAKQGIDPNDVAIDIGLVPQATQPETPTQGALQPGDQTVIDGVTIRRTR